VVAKIKIPVSIGKRISVVQLVA